MSDTYASAEPTVDFDGFSDEERAQLNQMRSSSDDTPASEPEPAADPPAPAPAPAPDEPPAPATDDDDDDDDAGETPPVVDPNAPPADPNAADKRRNPRVSLHKFRRVEEKATKLAAELAEANTKQTRLDERLRLLSEALIAPQAPPAAAAPPVDEDPEPDAEADIFAHNQWLARQNKKLASAIEDIRRGGERERAQADVASVYMTDAEQFRAKEPSFVAAYQFLIQGRAAELAMLNFGVDVGEEGASLTPTQIQQIKREIAGEERSLVVEAIKNKISPAQRIYSLARARGFRPSAAQAPAAPAGAAPAPAPVAAGIGQPAAPAPAGGAPASATVAPAGGSVVADEIARIKAGQDASLSLSNGGGQPASPLTAKKLADMGEEEFAELYAKFNDKDIRAIMERGG